MSEQTCETCRYGQDIPSAAVCKACKALSEYKPTYAALEAEVKRLLAEMANLEAEVRWYREKLDTIAVEAKLALNCKPAEVTGEKWPRRPAVLDHDSPKTRFRPAGGPGT